MFGGLRSGLAPCSYADIAQTTTKVRCPHCQHVQTVPVKSSSSQSMMRG